MEIGALLKNIANGLSEGISNVGTTTARAAAQANEVSRQAQSAQAAFNKNAMDTANSITDNRLIAQYGYNSAMMSNANNLNQQMWQQAANWNEQMWERQAAYNAEEAQKQRDWQEMMSNTQYQRAMNDMQKAGLNPILAFSQGGAGVPTGATASVSGAQMSSASAAMASGGLVGADSASINNYTGQMEYMAGALGLISAMIGGISTAVDAAGQLPEGDDMLDQIFGYENGNGEKISTPTSRTGEAIKRGIREMFLGENGSNAAYAADVAQRRGSKKK